MNSPEYVLQNGHICEIRLGEPSPMTAGQVDLKIAQHRRDADFNRVADPDYAATQGRLADQLEALKAEAGPQENA